MPASADSSADIQSLQPLAVTEHASVWPHTHTAISYTDAPVRQLFRWTLIAVVLTECRHSQYERDHDGDPGDPECLLPVALSLVGLQAHAALQQTCTQTQTHSVSDTVQRNRFLCKEASNPSFFLIAFVHL